MDVGGWLRGLGLDQYETVFSDNAIHLAPSNRRLGNDPEAEDDNVCAASISQCITWRSVPAR